MPVIVALIEPILRADGTSSLQEESRIAALDSRHVSVYCATQGVPRMFSVRMMPVLILAFAISASGCMLSTKTRGAEPSVCEHGPFHSSQPIATTSAPANQQSEAVQTENLSLIPQMKIRPVTDVRTSQQTLQHRFD